jgi:hypothetical protein
MRKSGQLDSEKAVGHVDRSGPQRRLDFPIDVPSSPRAPTGQHNGNGRVFDIVGSYATHHIVCIHAVDYIFGHRTKLSSNENIMTLIESFDEGINVGLVCVVIANEALSANGHRLFLCLITLS